MINENLPVLTKEQAKFLLDLELNTFAQKARAIASATQTLTFEDEYDRETFYTAIELGGRFTVHSDYYYINVLAPLNQVGFIADSGSTNPITGETAYTTTTDFKQAEAFLISELEVMANLEPYNRAEFLLGEYEANKKYGNLEEWLRSYKPKTATQPLVESVLDTPIVEEPAETEKVEEVEEVATEENQEVKHGKAQIRLK